VIIMFYMRKRLKMQFDRFVPSRNASSTTMPTLALDQSFNGNTSANMSSLDASAAAELSALSESMGIPAPNRRILSFKAPPPKASHAVSHIDAQRNYLLASNASASRGTAQAGAGAAGVKKRNPPYVPDKVLDAPGFQDDYYLNLIDWSSENRVAIALGDIAYVWDAESGSVTGMGDGT
jgi:cell division cycle protein 20 (cofactor of APC complex)